MLTIYDFDLSMTFFFFFFRDVCEIRFFLGCAIDSPVVFRGMSYWKEGKGKVGEDDRWEIWVGRLGQREKGGFS